MKFSKKHPLESVYGKLSPEKQERLDRSREAYKSFKARAREQRSFLEKVADLITKFAGSISFAIFHVVWFSAWIALNTDILPSFHKFDPYPFGFLTLIVSLEAIFLSIFVLMSQNRESKITDIREELNFQITLQSEQEISKLIAMMEQVHEKLDIDDSSDVEMKQMKEKIDIEKLQSELENEDR